MLFNVVCGREYLFDLYTSKFIALASMTSVSLLWFTSDQNIYPYEYIYILHPQGVNETLFHPSALSPEIWNIFSTRCISLSSPLTSEYIVFNSWHILGCLLSNFRCLWIKCYIFTLARNIEVSKILLSRQRHWLRWENHLVSPLFFSLIIITW